MERLEFPRQAAVGFSDDRTPVKHRLLNAFIGLEIGASPHVARKFGVPYTGHVIVDLTAGDFVSDGKNDFWCSSSPAICSWHASLRPNIHVRLYERDKAAFQSLLDVANERLPEIGFSNADSATWYKAFSGINRKFSTVHFFHGNSNELEDFKLHSYEWLFVLNDPNNIHSWALDMSRFKHVMSRRQIDGSPTFAAMLSTAGCNASGLKMLALEHRERWFDHINDAISIVQQEPRLDLMLFEIMGDAAQWAYLLLCPSKLTESDIRPYQRHFTREGLRVAPYSLRRDRDAFADAITRLFYTGKERANGRIWQI